jgi:hypothetical protein
MENISGSYSSTTKGLLAQDFVVKTLGELANVTAETITTAAESKTKDESSKSAGAKGGTVICTYLNSIGLFPDDLLNNQVAKSHFAALHPFTLKGYRYWATPFVEVMRSRLWISKFLLPICVSRYHHVISGKTTAGGLFTIYVGQPVCFLIGAAVTAVEFIRSYRKDSHGIAS